jgi:hypothetical protein
MERIESENFINRKIKEFRKLQTRNIYVLSIINLVTILKLIGVAIQREQLLTLENGIFVALDFFITILFGSDTFKLHRESKYLGVISATIKSNDNYFIQETEETFSKNINERAKQYFKVQK